MLLYHHLEPERGRIALLYNHFPPIPPWRPMKWKGSDFWSRASLTLALQLLASLVPACSLASCGKTPRTGSPWHEFCMSVFLTISVQCLGGTVKILMLRCFVFLFFKIYFITYRKGRYTERRRDREEDLPSDDSLAKWRQWLVLSQTEGRCQEPFWVSHMGAGSQDVGPSSTAFPDHKQRDGWKAVLSGLEPVSIWDPGAFKARTLGARPLSWAIICIFSRVPGVVRPGSNGMWRQEPGKVCFVSVVMYVSWNNLYCLGSCNIALQFNRHASE